MNTLAWAIRPATPLLAVCLVLAPTLANVRTITAVHAADLIEIEGGWTTRLTGVRAPAPDTAVGREAHDFTKRRLEGQRVKMFTYTVDDTAAGIVRDAEDRPFAEFHYGPGLSLDIGRELLERGLARVDEDYLPEHLEHYREVEAGARETGLGIWAP